MLDKLREYQRAVLDRSRNRVRSGLHRGIIQAPTGAGKTYIEAALAWLAHQRGTRWLILADRRRLISQIGGTLKTFGVPYGIVMAGETGGVKENIILASRDTLHSWHRNGKDLPPFDGIMIDECHKSMGDTYQAILARWPKACVIGFTATPARNDGKSLGDFYQWLECTVPPSQLVKEGFLIKPEVYAPLELANARKIGMGKGCVGDPVRHWIKHAEGMPTIGFASRVTESLELCERFKRQGISAEHVDASANDEEREEKYARLKNGDTKILCSVQLLVEGVDIPEVSCAIIWAKFGSLIQYYQGVGRIMRPAKGKTRAVVLDHSGAAGVHGLPGEDIEWSLDLGTTVAERRAKAMEENEELRTVVCKQCGFVFNGKPLCPMCGAKLPQPKKKRTMAEEYEASVDEILVRMTGEQRDTAVKERQQREWIKCIKVAIAKNMTAGAAAAMFQKNCRCGPWAAQVSPMPYERSQWKLPASQVFPQFVKVKA